MESLRGLPATQPPAEMRLVLIQQLLEQRGFVRVRDLAAQFGVSTVTVRNDLQVLEARELAQRVHGGAMPWEPSRGERPFEEGVARQSDEKAAIGAAAARLVSAGETISVDVGTTAAALAHALVARSELHDLTVVTSGITIALALEEAHPRITVLVCGGTLRPKQHSLVDPLATDMFRSLRVDTAFIGCNGVTVGGGITNVNLPEAAVKRAMVDAAARVITLADHTKIGVRALAPICEIDAIDALVTDGSADDAALDELRHEGVDVVVA